MQVKHKEEMPNPTTLMEQIGENRYSNPKLKFHKLLTKCWLLNNRKVSVLGLCVALLHKWNLSLPTNTASLLPLPLLRLHCFRIHAFAPSTQNKYFFTV